MEWDIFKAKKGRWFVRLYRSLSIFSLILAISGIIDILNVQRKKYWKRGSVLFVVGFSFFIEPAHKLKIDQNKLQNCRSNILNLVNVL
ncbi:hypothetical protein D1AOALGA4SA_8620 [Olavius algarvensis Delta 1 endosymbiont]|nr:hypothetical protein D1AOALGA4SA_8620 [Olavius algarvensis Delta 1 endosymbiont]